MVLKFEPPNARVLNFPKNSALVLIRLVLTNGDCVYLRVDPILRNDCMIIDQALPS